MLQNKASKMILVIIIALATYVGAWAALTIHNNYLTRFFDMVTMHQPTYNTFMAFKEGDFSRILEMTDPHEHRGQISRLNYHFDIILIPISLLYFIHEGPETLLVFQSFMLALAMLPLYLLVVKIFDSDKYKYTYAILIDLIYMLYLPVHNTNMDTFHPVALAPLFILFMIYFAISKKYFASIIFFLLSLTLKESVALATAAYGLVLILHGLLKKNIQKKDFLLGLFMIIFSTVWFLLVMYVFIPHFRNGSSYYIYLYASLGSTPMEIITGILLRPAFLIEKLTGNESLSYITLLMGPLAYFPLFGFLFLIPALPEFFINQLSIAPYMSNALGHYTATSVPFIFVALIYSLAQLKKIFYKFKVEKWFITVFAILILFTLLTSYAFSFIFRINDIIQENSPYRRISNEYFTDVKEWVNKLGDKNLKISATTNIAPHLGSRRYIYLASMDYKDADYVLVHTYDLTNVFISEEMEKENLSNILKDENYATIYHKDLFWVLKKVNYEQN
ncbi:DUF2079 domain-containing protein [candidate division WWE3 bacterium]|uniref:DUF2079 domain-containing protein n=1 Tax=candidate division WWE3 bacterium TaxID=2053526 RepID=A0A7X9DL38_UNCKA|nr:DUF2079 domain-containing protein [candidate division WWE3 bacterium]